MCLAQGAPFVGTVEARALDGLSPLANEKEWPFTALAVEDFKVFDTTRSQGLYILVRLLGSGPGNASTVPHKIPGFVLLW